MPQKSCIISCLQRTKSLEFLALSLAQKISSAIYMNRESGEQHTKLRRPVIAVKLKVTFVFSLFHLLSLALSTLYILWSLPIFTKQCRNIGRSGSFKWEKCLMAREKSQYLCLCITSVCDPVFLFPNFHLLWLHFGENGRPSWLKLSLFVCLCCHLQWTEGE